MIGSIPDEIRNIRKSENLNIIRKNSNRYRILLSEDDGSTTAYYFSTPVYNLTSRRLVERCFHENGNIFTAEGSNADINIAGEEIMLKNSEGTAVIRFDRQEYCRQYHRCGRILVSENVEIHPSLNGVVLKVKSNGNIELKFHVKTDTPFTQIRDNTKYFSLMKEEFTPFMSVSAIGMVDSSGNICDPVKIFYQKIDDNNYIVSVLAVSEICGTFMFEINLYEPKLFQDTTVENKNPEENNAFGGMGYIGKSGTYGEQWLYSRLDISKMSEILSTEIRRIHLHIPKYNNRKLSLAAFEVAWRFCSFGSNWDNKVDLSNAVSVSKASSNYCSLDITGLMVNQKTHDIKNSEGLILRTKEKNSGFLAIATGDNYYTPQILEINYKQI